MVDTDVEVNIMTKSMSTILGIKYNLSNVQLRIVNVPITPICGVS